MIASALAAPTARSQSTVSEWAAVPKGIRSCVAVAFQRSNQTLEGVIASGIAPSDARLADAFKLCRQLVDGLPQNVACKLPLPSGEQIETLCDQQFGLREGNGQRVITQDEAFAKAFTPQGSQLAVISVESADGRSRREQKIRAALNANERAVAPAEGADPVAKPSNIGPSVGSQQDADETQRLLAESRSSIYPYRAVIVCGAPDLSTLACFNAGRGVTTDLELRNGGDYKLYKIYEIGELGQVTRQGREINLRERFEIKMQNASNMLPLTLMIYDTKSGNMIYNESVGQFRVLRARN